MVKIEISGEGVFVNGMKIDKVTRADVINLNPLGNAEVALYIAADEVVVDHKPLGIRE